MNKYELTDQIPYDAVDDEEAVTLAPSVQIPVIDDSDFAILFAADGRTIWTLKA